MLSLRKIVVGDSHLEFIFEGTTERGFPQAQAHLETMVETCRTHAIQKVLCNFTTITYTLDSDILGEHALAQALLHPDLVAHKWAVLLPEKHEEETPHAENVARNRGILMRTFTERDEALEWLSRLA